MRYVGSLRFALDTTATILLLPYVHFVKSFLLDNVGQGIVAGLSQGTAARASRAARVGSRAGRTIKGVAAVTRTVIGFLSRHLPKKAQHAAKENLKKHKITAEAGMRKGVSSGAKGAVASAPCMPSSPPDAEHDAAGVGPAAPTASSHVSKVTTASLSPSSMGAAADHARSAVQFADDLPYTETSSSATCESSVSDAGGPLAMQRKIGSAGIGATSPPRAMPKKGSGRMQSFKNLAGVAANNNNRSVDGRRTDGRRAAVNARPTRRCSNMTEQQSRAGLRAEHGRQCAILADHPRRDS
eukprot:7381466-Prymnesium_polylepis.3